MIRSAGGSEETLVSSVFLQNRRRCDHKAVWRLKTGTCEIYVYAVNGLSQKIVVTVG